jgi:hypothetical protein
MRYNEPKLVRTSLRPINKCIVPVPTWSWHCVRRDYLEWSTEVCFSQNLELALCAPRRP